VRIEVLQLKIIIILLCCFLYFTPSLGATRQSTQATPTAEAPKDIKNGKSVDLPWPLIAAIVSATIAFIFSQVQKRLDFQSLRKSTAIVLWVEILEAKNSAASLYISWKHLKASANENDPKPLLVISSDIHLLERVQIETLSFSPAVVTAITRFHNTIREFYQCLNTISSESFRNTTPDRRQEIVEMTISISGKVEQRASEALDIMRQDLPSRWFKTVVEHDKLDRLNVTHASSGPKNRTFGT
jgi:hypothetical protein